MTDRDEKIAELEEHMHVLDRMATDEATRLEEDADRPR